jgi:hypothetical protein
MSSALERPAESRRIRTAYASSFVLCLIIGLVGLVALVLGGAPSDPGPGQGADLGRFRLIATLVAVACMSLSIAGALLLRRRWRRRRARLIFAVPPSWPTPPERWSPPVGWSPSSEFPEPPSGWQFWREH